MVVFGVVSKFTVAASGCRISIPIGIALRVALSLFVRGVAVCVAVGWWAGVALPSLGTVGVAGVPLLLFGVLPLRAVIPKMVVLLPFRHG